MELWQAFVYPVVPAISGMLVLGWRDGWFRRHQTDGLAHVHRQSVSPHANYLGIAEVARFAAMRRRIGYDAGSRIMECLSARIAQMGGFEVARIGRTSIEFVYHAESAEMAGEQLRDLKEGLERPILFANIAFDPEICIGSVPACRSRSREELFDAAARAVEDSQDRTDRILLARDSSLLACPDPSGDMLWDLRAAIQSGALELHYMPKLTLRNDSIVCAEALCRWAHPDRAPVPASTFIRLAEETGLIEDLTLWVLGRAIADQECLLVGEGIELQIDVNVSGQLLDSPEFCERLIAAAGSAKARIGIEITETAVIQHPDRALASLERIKAAGIHIAIDDFGSGLASLAYLRDLPADELKIDQMFVRKLTTSHRDPLLVRSAIEIGHALEMEVTAEGVEDPIALALLRVMRCDNVQGYQVSPPLPFRELVEYLKDSARQQAGSNGTGPLDGGSVRTDARKESS